MYAPGPDSSSENEDEYNMRNRWYPEHLEQSQSLASTQKEDRCRSHSSEEIENLVMEQQFLIKKELEKQATNEIEEEDVSDRLIYVTV